MRVIHALRDRKSSRARLAVWSAVVAALCFALLPVLHAHAMAAPPGFTLVCTGDGVALIPDDPALPPLDGPVVTHAAACLDCCPAKSAAVPPPGLQTEVVPPEISAPTVRAPAAPPGVPLPRPFPRGPPRA